VTARCPTRHGDAVQEPINQALRTDATVTATVQTTCGTIVIDLAVAEFPQTVNNFVFLARNGFYDGIGLPPDRRRFRDPGRRSDGQRHRRPGYTIPDEFPAAGFVYEPGVVAMANAGRGTTGSQFFIVTGSRRPRSIRPSTSSAGWSRASTWSSGSSQVPTRRQSGGANAPTRPSRSTSSPSPSPSTADRNPNPFDRPSPLDTAAGVYTHDPIGT
jgi:cyclophilin family peptidyl-prolyl cis-trans isomerase